MTAIDSIKKHVRHLAVEIGPRGSTLPAEVQAAEYAASVYREMGLSPLTENYRSVRSAYSPFILGMGLILLGEGLFLFGGQTGGIAGAAIAVIALVSLILELNFIPNPLRWMSPTGSSQNVGALIPAGGETRRKVVFIGHLDTHRTPLIWRSQGWFGFYQLLSKLTFGGAFILTVICILSIFIEWTYLPLISLIAALPVVLMFLMVVQASLSPYTSGANDNATGAAVVMGLAERLTRTPLQHMAVWAVNTGCEEVGAYGAAAWVDAHRNELDEHTIYITLDTIGGAGSGPCYLTKETLIFPFVCDPELVKLAGQIAADHPELGAYALQQEGAYTEGAIGIRAGLRCLTFVNYRPDGILPNWHQPSDTYENVDWDVVQRTEAFVWYLLQALDE